MKNKPDPALLQPLNISNEIKKRVPKSRETIPLNSIWAIPKVRYKFQAKTVKVSKKNNDSLEKFYKFLFFSSAFQYYIPRE
jgi:hypothetical protein